MRDKNSEKLFIYYLNKFKKKHNRPTISLPSIEFLGVYTMSEFPVTTTTFGYSCMHGGIALLQVAIDNRFASVGCKTQRHVTRTPITIHPVHSIHFYSALKPPTTTATTISRPGPRPDDSQRKRTVILDDKLDSKSLHRHQQVCSTSTTFFSQL